MAHIRNLTGIPKYLVVMNPQRLKDAAIVQTVRNGRAFDKFSRDIETQLQQLEPSKEETPEKLFVFNKLELKTMRHIKRYISQCDGCESLLSSHKKSILSYIKDFFTGNKQQNLPTKKEIKQLKKEYFSKKQQ